MTAEIGTGKIVDGFYQGTIPFDDETDVCLVRTDDLVDICKHEEELLSATSKIMPLDLYDCSREQPSLINELIYTASDLTEHKLFLDRRMFGSNPKDMIWIRYLSVDQEEAEAEE